MAKYDQEYVTKWLEKHPQGYCNIEDDKRARGTIKLLCQIVADGYQKRGSKDIQQAILDVEWLLQDNLSAYGKKVLRKYFKERDLL